MHANQKPIGELTQRAETWNPSASGENEPFFYVDIASVDNEEKRIFNAGKVSPLSAPSRARQKLRAGDVVVSTVRPNLNAVAMVTEDLDGATGSTGFCVLRPLPGKLDSRYLYHWVQTREFVSHLVGRSTGASYPAVTDSVVRSAPIPDPGFEGQRRIAAILDKADAIRRKHRQALAEIDVLLRATFLDMFGDPRTNPKGYKTTALENVCERIVDCLHTTPRHKEIVTPYPSIRTSDLQNGFLDFSTTKYVEQDEYNERIVRHRPVAGDIIYSREGERLGIAALIPQGLNVCLGQRTMLFSIDTKRATPEFVWRWLNSKSTYELATSNIGGATSPHINIGDIRKFDMIQPPLEGQRQFSQICAKIIGKRQSILSFEEDANRLLGSLSQRAFRGEL